MKTLTPEVLNQAVTLIDELRSGVLTDDEQSDVVVKIDQLLLDPHWFDYTIDHLPELSAEEIVRKAFEYKPIQL
jgi:hypothetical protein